MATNYGSKRFVCVFLPHTVPVFHAPALVVTGMIDTRMSSLSRLIGKLIMWSLAPLWVILSVAGAGCATTSTCKTPSVNCCPKKPKSLSRVAETRFLVRICKL